MKGCPRTPPKILLTKGSEDHIAPRPEATPGLSGRHCRRSISAHTYWNIASLDRPFISMISRRRLSAST